MKKKIEIQTAYQLIGGITQLGVEAGTNAPKGGDCELSTMIRALKFALVALKGTAAGAETRLRETLL